MKTLNFIKKIYIRTCGYSYTNLGRLFLRLFVGIMLLQFAVKQIAEFNIIADCFTSVAGMSPQVSLISLILVESVCSVFIMFGFLTRIMSVPPFVAMAVAEYELFSSVSSAAYMFSWQSQGYLPIMFMGIYFFIMLVGPGKISVDYFLSLHFIHSADKSEDEELEEV